MIALATSGTPPGLTRLLDVAGYNADPGFHPSDAFAIHHPGGNAKRISFVNNTCAHAHVPTTITCLREPDAERGCQSMPFSEADMQYLLGMLDGYCLQVGLTCRPA